MTMTVLERMTILQHIPFSSRGVWWLRVTAFDVTCVEQMKSYGWLA